MMAGEAACTVAALLAIDPAGLGGVCLRAPADSRRDAWLAAFRSLLPARAPCRRVRSSVTDAQLFGGIDLTESLRRGSRVARQGVLAAVHEGVLVISMAERLGAAMASRINAVVDAQHLAPAGVVGEPTLLHFAVVAFDEGIDEEAAPASLLDRLAFHLSLGESDPRTPLDLQYSGRAIERARKRYQRMPVDANTPQLIGEAADALGVESLRVQILAARVARAAAALHGVRRVGEAEIRLAIELVLAPRATRLPAAEDEQTATAPEEPPESGPSSDAETQSEAPGEDSPGDPPDQSTVAAVQTQVPKDLLERLRPQLAQGLNRGSLGRSGAKTNSGRRGRPAGITSRPGGGGSRIDLVATLQAAIPWQKLRRRDRDSPVRVLAADFRFTRFKQQSRTLVVFAVDASGSSALYRLAEAKGAVELILGECYVRRDEVAVIAFRNRSAQLLLPPTRSLVRARQQLAGLPGGGGTPVASGLAAASAVALAARRRGDTPLLVLLTDGHANVDLAGAPGREAARSDALRVARQIAAAGVGALLIDSARRPQPLAQELASALKAQYIPLPSSDSAAIAASVRNPMRRKRAGK